ncbi:hypothetical protein [Vibrio mediterranei]|uniref:hypothetical protein n=1 Tax=Vibrio mediterranei TaxID=689 RepID=UPI00148CE046|nr:hypothetical protein [Vibrio mediterranei]NOI24393.1 hypothetical protein [Vibrio mediterranei]
MPVYVHNNQFGPPVNISAFVAAAQAAAAWVHHANAGHVGIADVNAAIVALGNPPVASILVIFAHPGAQDAGYNGSIATIAAQGIPANNIVEIPNLLVPQFGINNLGMIG